jgi:cell division protease FtsH
VLLGGRAAEEIVFGKISTGAANDIVKSTDVARKMITDYGMSKRFHNVALTSRSGGMLGEQQQEPQFTREYSEATQQYVDDEVARMEDERYALVKDRLTAHRPILEKIAAILLEKETLDEKEFKTLVESEV